MKTFLSLVLLTTMTVAATEDPNLWLEEIEGKEALAWVKTHNDKTLPHFEADKNYKTIEEDVRRIALAKDRVPAPTLMGQFIYNFWQDEQHVRGLWRRTSLENYEKTEITWETVLDIDKLAVEEKENWVWKGVSCLPSEHKRCLVSLSRGGKDAAVVREFDTISKTWIVDGFNLPEAKSNVGWKDENTVYVGTDFGAGSLTLSGYPRIVKLWTRGTALSQATTVYEGQEADVSVSGYTVFRPETNLHFINRSPSFFESELYWFEDPAKLVKSPFPLDVEYKGVFDQFLLVWLRKDWSIKGKTYESGTVLSLPVSRLSEPNFDESLEVVFAPTEKTALKDLVTTQSAIYVFFLDNVNGKLAKIKRACGGWGKANVMLPNFGNISPVAADDFSDTLIASYESFTVPSSYYRMGDMSPKIIKQMPARFNSEGIIAEQFEATSKDGVKIPYFLVHKKDFALDGKNPTLLYGYGGFEISEIPAYIGTLGKVWLEKGGVYALANIRGGGEFGPKWHKAALTVNKQKSYDDFIAIAEHLIERKVTSPKHLGIQGGSNGGLLVGATFTQRPELFNAVLCEVPLLDMQRYHKLLAGHSWTAEYGNPDDPKMWEVIKTYSPYQNLFKDKNYPQVFLMTSTKDDRVHPGHARKMIAKMESLGYTPYYFENMEGGHSAAANIEQMIKRRTLEFTYLFQQLTGSK